MWCNSHRWLETQIDNFFGFTKEVNLILTRFPFEKSNRICLIKYIIFLKKMCAKKRNET